MTPMKRLLRGAAAIAGLLGALVTCSRDTSPLAVLPTDPTGSEVRSENLSGQVGQALGQPVTVRVVDRFGNPVPDLEIAWTVAAGGGSTNPSMSRTDRRGEATTQWTLGTVAGTHTLTIAPRGLDATTLAATAVAGPPRAIAAVGGNEQSRTVATEVPDSLAVRVVDEYGNPVGGATVTWAATNGSVSPATVTTGTAGEARTRLVLGTVAGEVTVTASVAAFSPVAPARFRASALAGPPARVVKAGGDEQRAPPLSALADSLSVRVSDLYDNPVAGVQVVWAPATGAGTADPATATTGPTGVATTRWTLGPAAGRTTLSASVAGLQPVAFAATVIATTLNLSIEGVHLNQGSQTAGGVIPVIAGRAGLLRVIVRANEPNSSLPPLRVRLYQGAVLRREVLIPRASPGIPLVPDLSLLQHTYNLSLRGDEVVEGLSVEAELDPAETIPETTREDNRWPRGAGSAAMQVVGLAPLRIVFIPVYSSVLNRTGNIHAGNVGAFLEATRQWIPSSTIEYVIRQPFTTHVDLRVGANWSTALAEIQAARTAEGARDEYYHGIIGDFSGIPYGGIGYVPGSPGSTLRSSLSYDRHPWAAGTVAHEIGHNMGRRHAPCGSPPNTDLGFPHPNARLGSPGFDILQHRLLRPLENADYMSYCSPQWTSDYTFAGILQWRRSDPLARPAGAPEPARTPSAEGLLVWGQISSRSAVLEPAFTLRAPPVLPNRPGPNLLRGVAGDGSELFRISFEGEPVADGPDPGERHFAFLVPLGDEDRRRLASIELVTPSGRATRAAARAGPAGDRGAGTILAPLARLDVEPGEVRVRWSAADFPMAMVRDPETGQVLSFARGGDVRVQAAGIGSARLEILLSDGVRSFVATRE
jgi:hypothetical protein